MTQYLAALLTSLFAVLLFSTSANGLSYPVFFIEGDGWQNQTHGGYIGHFKIPVYAKLNGWWFALIYSQPITEMEAWQGKYFKRSPDRHVLYIQHISWNKRQYPGMVLDQRFLIGFRKKPDVSYEDYFGPRPDIVFLDKVYRPDALDNHEHNMTVLNLDEYTLPGNFEMLPVNIVTTVPSVTTEATTTTSPGPNAPKYWFVQAPSAPPVPPSTRATTRSTTTASTTTTAPTTTTVPQFYASCRKKVYENTIACGLKGRKLKSCYIPQCSAVNLLRYRVVQCFKHLGYCWCVNPVTNRRRKGRRKIVRFQWVHRLDCFSDIQKPTTTSSPTTTTTARATLPTLPPGSDPLQRPLFVPRNNYDYNLVMQNSLLFFDAQRSGNIGNTGRVYWRTNSHLDDGSDIRRDLSGGYYVSGDYVKYGFPTAASMTMLAWGFLEFKDAYEETLQKHFLKETLKWGADYFIKAHIRRHTFVGQVGNSDVENSYWERPQDMRIRRPCYTITEKNPGSDLAAETAAALAATAKVWLVTGSSTSDPYVASLLQHARQLYDFANSHRGIYSYSIREALEHYASSSYGDELAWAALWLYEATGESRYLAEGGTHYVEFGLNTEEVELSWDKKTIAVQILLAKYAHRSGAVNAAHRYANRVTAFCNHNRPGSTSTYTPQGLMFHSEWGANRYAANAAFACLVASKLPVVDDNLKITYRQFAENQVDYILGKTGRSFVVGYGYNFPRHIHHRASSCKTFGACGWDAFHSNKSNPQVLYGAMVGGPDSQDYYKDERSNFKSNSVGLDYNAGLQGVVAGLKHFQIQYKKWITYTRQEARNQGRG